MPYCTRCGNYVSKLTRTGRTSKTFLCWQCTNKGFRYDTIIMDDIVTEDTVSDDTADVLSYAMLVKAIHDLQARGLNMPSAYKRRTSWMEQSTVIQVSLIWDSLTNAGYIFSMKPFIKQKCEPIILWIKGTVPVSQREYDPQTYSWFIGEKFALQLKDVIETFGSDYNINFVEKPEAAPTAAFHSKEDDFVRLKDIFELAGIITSEQKKEFTTEFSEDGCKKFYFKAAMKLHPDYNKSEASAKLMAEMTEIWARLKQHKFTQVEI